MNADVNDMMHEESDEPPPRFRTNISDSKTDFIFSWGTISMLDEHQELKMETRAREERRPMRVGPTWSRGARLAANCGVPAKFLHDEYESERRRSTYTSFKMRADDESEKLRRKKSKGKLLREERSRKRESERAKKDKHRRKDGSKDKHIKRTRHYKNKREERHSHHRRKISDSTKERSRKRESEKAKKDKHRRKDGSKDKDIRRSRHYKNKREERHSHHRRSITDSTKDSTQKQKNPMIRPTFAETSPLDGLGELAMSSLSLKDKHD